MEGGTSLTYEDCADALSNLIPPLSPRTDFAENIFELIISTDGHQVIRIATTKETGQYTHVRGGYLEFHGLFWPGRRVPFPDIDSNLARAIFRMRENDPEDLLPREFRLSLQRRQTRALIDIRLQGGRTQHCQLITYSDMTEFLNAIHAYFQRQPHGAELWGHIAAHGRQCGIFRVLAQAYSAS